MIKLDRIILLIFYISSIYGLHTLSAQTSSLVFIGSGGKLEYRNYANTGQNNQVNKIPDFSHAGYKGGGVALPDVPVVEIISPASGDLKSLIQSAIDRVSALPININGFRGTVLLKSGRYEVNGPLFIKKSGVVIRGEGQNTTEKSGTEIVATSKTQHNFIQLQGNESSFEPTTELILDTKIFPAAHTWQELDVLRGVVEELEGDKLISFHITADINQYVSYSSREDTLPNSPFLEITLNSRLTGADEIVKLYPVADTYVQGGASAKISFGSDLSLAVKNSGVNNDVTREAYLKFDLSGIRDSVKSATLKLLAKKDLAGDPAAIKIVNISVSYIQNDSWEEMILTYESRPNTVGITGAKRITSAYVPTGSATFEVEDVSGFSVGDSILVTRTPNDVWINALDMAQYGWVASEYRISYERIITGITGNSVTVNIPLVQAIEDGYGGGEITKFSVKGRINNCGVENLLITSYYTGDNDESHGWSAVTLSETSDCWVRNVTARYFGYSCVGLYRAYNTTVQDCAQLDPKSITTGSRKYSFYIDKGSFNLFQRCYTRGGRHDYVTGSRVAGPNVFVDCYATQTYADIGPHHRYATGILFDNIRGGETRVQNRKDMGSGHGWAGAQTMFWNCKSDVSEFKVESPVGALNYGVGCVGLIKSGAGSWESWGTQVTPRSLYFRQLQDRLGLQGVINVTTAEQRAGNIWESISKWAGVGDPSTTTDSNLSEDKIPTNYSLGQNYPNPFNPCTVISYQLPVSSLVTLKIYDILGREAATLVDAVQLPGYHNSKFSILNSQFCSGVYLYRLEAGEFSSVKKMVLIK